MLLRAGSALALLLAACVAASAAGEASPPPAVHVERIEEFPDLLQTDPELGLAGSGDQFCGPVAVANSLLWLARHGYPELVHSPRELPRRLSDRPFMNTSTRNGTGPGRLMRGLARYLDATPYRYRRLEYQGWRRMPARFTAQRKTPDLDSIKRGLSGKGGVWLNVGWYQRDGAEGDYRRRHGHWVTLVGYGQRADGTPDPAYLVVHDPSPRAGREPAHEFVALEPLRGGRLTGRYQGLPRDAAGLYAMRGGMHVRKDADAAILDGVVVLEMAPPPEPR